MKKILIIGGGFAGLAALNVLIKSKIALDINLVDTKQHSDFSPLLPDCLGRRLNPEFLRFDIRLLNRDSRVSFINEEAVSLDLEKREAFTKNKRLTYDYLVIASGSLTNFYGNDAIKQYAYKIDDTEDIKKLSEALKQGAFENYIIAGGGYTGVEVATNLRLFLEKNKYQGKIIIVERTESILGPLPLWMKDYVTNNLKKMQVDVWNSSIIEKISGKQVYVSQGRRVLDRSILIWVAGVRTADFIQKLDVEKNPQGRIKVDKYLKLSENCFVAGDAAYFAHKDTFLRMAVQFAITQGERCAKNILNSVRGKELKEYKPKDLGYIIPMANNISCGSVSGINLKGHLATMLHFLMCIYRSKGPRNKFGLITNILWR